MKKLSTSLLMLLMALLAIPSAMAANPLANDSDDDEDEPYVEPAFTVYIDIDNADAVYFTINDKPVSHTAGLNTVTVDPGDGYLKVHVNDGFVFTRFTDIDANSDYLQYSTQTMPVTIRKVLATGAEEGVIVDGHTFKVQTVDTSSYEKFTLTVEVDDASLTELIIGAAIDADSSANRTVALSDGVNTVTYTSADKYLHLRGRSFRSPLHSVTLDGSNVQGDSQMNSVFTIPLRGARTEGAHIVVTAKEPEVVEPYSFTATVDNPDFIKYFTKCPANVDLNLKPGDNTVTFSDGDYFEIWTRKEAMVCTFNGVAAEYNPNWNRYVFTPTDGGTLLVSFAEEVVCDKAFALVLEEATRIGSLSLTSASGRSIDLDPGHNIVPFNAEADQAFTLTFGSPQEAVYLNGEEILPTGYADYVFTPADGDIVRSYHSGVPDLHPVAFDISPKVAGKFAIVRDEIQNVDTDANASELHGTIITITPAGTPIRVFLSLPSYLRSAGDSDEELYPDFDGSFRFAVHNPLAVKVTDATGSGIAAPEVAPDAASPAVYYNLQGIRVANPAPGLYIRRSGSSTTKVVVKK